MNKKQNTTETQSPKKLTRKQVIYRYTMAGIALFCIIGTLILKFV